MIDLRPIHRAAATPLSIVTGLGLELGNGSRDELVFFRCPSHRDKKPSARAVRKDGVFVWICGAGCGGGDVLTLVAAARGLDHRSNFRQVAEAAAQLVGVSITSTHAPKPPPERDPVVELAQRIDQRGEAWLSGKRELPELDPAKEPSVELVDEALALLLEADASAVYEPFDEDAYWDQRLEQEADRHARWASYPDTATPVHTAKDGPPPPEYFEHLRDLVRGGWMRKPAWLEMT